jgi:hypothetical protein
MSIAPARTKSGYVYLLHPEGHNVYKIGESNDPDRRKLSLERKLHKKLIFDAIIHSDDCWQLEQQIQARVFGSHLGGDWFALDEEIVSWIRSLQ